MKNIKNLIEKNYNDFSKGHKKIADFVMANISDAAFMTAKEIGAKAGVSEATTVRFAYNLGYKSFGAFMTDLGGWAKKDLALRADIEGLNANNIPDAIKNTLKKDIENLSQTLEDINPEAFICAIEMLMKAKKVYIIGQGLSCPLAEFFAANLNLFRDNVRVVTAVSSEEIFEQLLYLNEGDAVIGISFPDYSMRTIKALELANDRRAKIITLTDCKYSPLNMYSSCNLLANCALTENTGSLTAPLSLINCLLVGLELKYGKNLKNNKKNLEEIWKNYAG